MSATGSTILRKAGGSLIATIPKSVVDQEHLRDGDEVLVTVRRRAEAFDELANLLKDLGPVERSYYRARDRY